MKSAPGLVPLVVAFVILALLFTAMERRFGARPARGLFRRERRVDLLYWFFTPWITQTISGVSLAIVVVGLTLLAQSDPSAGVVSPAWFLAQPPGVQFLGLLIAADFLGYAQHRLFHGRSLWRFHAIHHSSEDLDWLSSVRVHPVNEILGKLLQIVPIYLLGFRGTVLASIVPMLTFYALLVHANLRWDFGPLRYVIASPAFHRWHHTSQQEGLDKNFAGLFPWIDLLFGTFYMPRQRQPEHFGITDPVPGTLLGQIAYPFTRRQT